MDEKDQNKTDKSSEPPDLSPPSNKPAESIADTNEPTVFKSEQAPKTSNLTLPKLTVPKIKLPTINLAMMGLAPDLPNLKPKTVAIIVAVVGIILAVSLIIAFSTI